MYSTAEVRWFTRGPLPEPVVAWFEAVAGAPAWGERTDCYVRPACRDGLGVKWREGTLEVKRRLEIVGEERLHEGVVGCVERWRKWTLPLVQAASVEEPAGDWVDVHKRRRIRDWTVAGAQVRRVPDEAYVAQGCSLELGQVEVGGRVWWSVCLEAFGADEDRLTDDLRRVARHVFANDATPTLAADRSMSYPVWLLEAV